MKTYGARPHDVARCSYGCCGGKLTALYKGTVGEQKARKAARKRARREARAEIEVS